MAISHSVQDYLKTIYKLQNGHGASEPVNTTLLSETMGVAAASVTSMFKKLAEMNLVSHTPYKGVALTDVGEKAALKVVRHHRLLERYLMDTLGYSWDEVDAEADRLEHAISEEFEERIDRALGYPTIDPHGDPIPTRDGNIKRFDTSRLSEVDVGQRVEIRHVSDHDPKMLRYMEDLGLVPSAIVVVRERAPFNGPLLVVTPEGEHALGLEVARYIFVVDPE